MSNPEVARKWVALAAEDDVPEGGVILVPHGRVEVLLFRKDGELRAYDNMCPHAGAPIQPYLYDGECITCAYHGLRFRARDGICPDATGWELDAYPVRVEHGQILVGIPERFAV